MEERIEQKTKPQVGEWDNIKPYPPKVVFEIDKPVTVKFDESFEKPRELPQKDGNGVFYVFPCMIDGKEHTLMTSSWTLLQGLKTQEPLAGKSFVITKKNVSGKNQFYISLPQNELAKKETEVDFTELPQY